MSLGATKFIDAAGFDLFELFEPWQSGDPNAAATGLQADDGSGNWKDLNQLFAPVSVGSQIDHDTGFQLGDGSNDDLRVVFAKLGSRAGSPISASIPAALTAGTGIVGGTASIDVTCSPAGGDGGPYTFAWSVVSGGAAIANAAQQTCTASEAVPGTGSVQSTIKCHVSDGSGNSCDSNDCVITFKYKAPGGGGGGCPMLGMEALLEDGRAKPVERLQLTDVLAAWDQGERIPGGRPLRYAPVVTLQPCLVLETPFGEASFSVSTPFDLPNGESRLAAGMHGCEVLHHRLHGDFWERAGRIEALPGKRPAVRIGIGGMSFAVRAPGTHVWIVSHNTGKQ